MVKVIKFASNAIDKIVSIILVLFLLIGIYILYDNIYIFYDARLEKVIGFKPDNKAQAIALKKDLSEECVAWITIDGSSIDYPIMQADDNMKYLNKDPYGEYSLSGSIFLDFRNNSEFQDQYSLLYGHHMDNEYMFGALDNWFKKDYFDSHLTGELILTSTGKSYDFHIFAIGYAYTTDNVIFNPENHYPLDYITENSTYYNEPIEKDGKILILSTCVGANSTKRIILSGILRERG